jgi:hypothetical protein
MRARDKFRFPEGIFAHSLVSLKVSFNSLYLIFKYRMKTHSNWPEPIRTELNALLEVPLLYGKKLAAVQLLPRKMAKPHFRQKSCTIYSKTITNRIKIFAESEALYLSATIHGGPLPPLSCTRAGARARMRELKRAGKSHGPG